LNATTGRWKPATAGVCEQREHEAVALASAAALPLPDLVAPGHAKQAGEFAAVVEHMRR
jgi:hypothetical protein